MKEKILGDTYEKRPTFSGENKIWCFMVGIGGDEAEFFRWWNVIKWRQGGHHHRLISAAPTNSRFFAFAAAPLFSVCSIHTSKTKLDYFYFEMHSQWYLTLVVWSTYVLLSSASTFSIAVRSKKVQAPCTKKKSEIYWLVQYARILMSLPFT